MLEDAVGLGEGLVDVSAAKVIVERDIGIPLSREVFEVGEHPGRLQLVMHIGGRGHRLDLIVDRRKLIVIDCYRLRCGRGDVRVIGEHDRDWLAGETHLAERQDRLVMERRAEIGVGDDGEDILANYHRMHAGYRLGGAGVDASDARMRHGAAADLGVQHARQAQIVDIFGTASDLGPRLDPRQRAADLATGRRSRVAHAASARCRARRRCTSTSTRL